MNTSFLFGLDPCLVRDYYCLDAEYLFSRVGGNTGNLAFCQAILRHLDPLPIYGWDEDLSTIPSEGLHGLMVCSNNIGDHIDMGCVADQLLSYRGKLAVVGLGVQSDLSLSIPVIPQGTRDWLSQVASLSSSDSPNIAVRGEFTYSVLNSLGLEGQSIVVGCPSLFLNPDHRLGRAIMNSARSEPNSIAVVAGHPDWHHLAPLELKLTRIVETTPYSDYIVQAPLELVKLARGDLRGLHPSVLSKCRDYCLPGSTIDSFVQWMKIHAKVFFDYFAWMDFCRQFDLVIGTRLHGVMAAIQAGVPAVCICSDSRTLELCQTMHLPHITIDDAMKSDDLVALSSSLPGFHPDAFDQSRSELAVKYYLFLSANGLPVKQDILSYS